MTRPEVIRIRLSKAERAATERAAAAAGVTMSDLVRFLLFSHTAKQTKAHQDNPAPERSGMKKPS